MSSPTTPTPPETIKKGHTLEEVRGWSESRVAEWLSLLNMPRLGSVFIENNINGSVLLDLDYEAMKTIDVQTVGERVRLLVAIKSLRHECYSSAVKAARAKQFPGNPEHRAGWEARSPIYNTTPVTTPYNLQNNIFSTNLDNHGRHEGFNITSPHPDKMSKSTETKGLLNRSNSFSRFLGRSDSKKSQKAAASPSNPPQDTPPLPPSPKVVQKRNSLEGGIMSMEKVKQTCVKVFGEDGQTRIVNVHNSTEAKIIMAKVLHKFGIDEGSANRFCIFVGSGTNGEARALSDEELIEICRSTDRPEKERLILRKRHMYPTHEEFKRKGTINARKQLQRLRDESQSEGDYASSHISTPRDGSGQPFNGWGGDRLMPLDSNVGGTPWTSSANLQSGFSSPEFVNQRQEYPSLVGGPIRAGSFRSQNHRRIRRFFGERPPSEIISSNLPSFFPNHKRETLETAGINAKRISMTRRYSGSTKHDSQHNFRNSVLPELVSVLGVDLGKFSEDDEYDYEEEEEEEEEDEDNKEAKGQESEEDEDEDQKSNETDDDDSNESDERKPGGLYTSLNPEDEDLQLESHESIPKDEDESTSLKPPSAQTSRIKAMQNRSSSLLHLNESKTKVVLAEIADYDALLEQDEYSTSEVEKIYERESWTKPNQTTSATTGSSMPWLKGSLIGRGTFGDVYLGLNPISGELMAVKQVELPVENSATEERKKSMVEALHREITLLKELHHENIVQYLASQTDDAHFSIFLEYVPGGSVAGLLASYGAFQEPLVKSFVKQILKGLNYLHGKDIVHRDIKGANVLVDNKAGVKITDFGISKKVEEDILQMSGPHRPSLQGSIFWYLICVFNMYSKHCFLNRMAPEVVKQTHYTRKADVWSLGCMIVEMFTGDHPFPEYSQMQAIFQIGSYMAPNIPTHISDDAKDFLECTFRLNHEERPTAEELLKHPFLYMGDT
ncbi:hypothetical protein CLU79DRAFT_744638 [Phycomyces nitens]|nr:hypothetical protein CLU79DRAFT_744638 [Phycomyces nitens]